MKQVEMNKNMKLSELYGLRLSPHFTLGEMTKTNHKTADGNIPSRLRYSYNTLYHPEGLVINSGYRSPEVNRLAGGSPTSNHLTGCAVDIHVSGFEQAVRYASILLDIAEGTKCDYDELYIERNKAGSYWIHFAVRPTDSSATQGDACLSKNRRKADFLKV